MAFAPNRGRLVGLIYLLVSIPGFFALVYVPSKLIVHGDAAATAANIVASENLFRAGIACNVLMEILFMGVALALFDLFQRVDRRLALLMVGLLVVSTPIAILNELNPIAALLLIQGTPYLAAFDLPQRQSLAMLFLRLHAAGFDLTGFFWGLWLFPMGLLVYRSRFIPRILGILLMLNCVSYVVNSFTALALPAFEDTVSRWMKPLGFGELLFMLWILIMGARPFQPVMTPSRDEAVTSSS